MMGSLRKLLRGSQEQKAIEEYNLALAAKYRGEWRESLRGNEEAQNLRPGDVATLWNLAIAATALREWDRARFAWRALGIELLEDEGEVHTPETTACVRLQPEGVAEVVWGTRIDPARIRIENVPLPNSERRFGDIILNDGAEEGKRLSRGTEYPVFNELGVWEKSQYSTFEATLIIPTQEAMDSLERLCGERDMQVENWGTVRVLCAVCSRGNPGEHSCAEDAGREERIGFASTSETALKKVLAEWTEVQDGAKLMTLEIALTAALV